MIKKSGMVLFVADIILGLYFLNAGINFIPLPAFIIPFNNLLNIVGGILLILGGVLAMRSFSYRIMR